jgi:hypothetical protein
MSALPALLAVPCGGWTLAPRPASCQQCVVCCQPCMTATDSAHTHRSKVLERVVEAGRQVLVHVTNQRLKLRAQGPAVVGNNSQREVLIVFCV